MTPEGEVVRLQYASDIAIKRHTKIKAEANPFAPEWEQYFEERLERTWKTSMKGRWKLVSLWLEQDKRCLVCNSQITRETGWNIHHLIERHLGGTEILSNLVLLHPNCHRQVHSLGISLYKPVQP